MATKTKKAPVKKAPAKKAPAKKAPAKTSASDADVHAIVAWLRRTGTTKTREGMARYAIPSTNAFGIPVGVLRQYAKRFGRNQALAAALWKTGHYEARMLATFIGDPDAISSSEMDAWCRDFDSWAICDTACFALFDRTPYAWSKVEKWAKSKDEFVKRAAFALVACLSVHDKTAPDARFHDALVLVERGASDPRNFVSKAVNWALRSAGKRSVELHEASVALARRLATSTDAPTRWVGKDALRDLASASVARRLAARSRGARSRRRPPSS